MAKTFRVATIPSFIRMNKVGHLILDGFLPDADNVTYALAPDQVGDGAKISVYSDGERDIFLARLRNIDTEFNMDVPKGWGKMVEFDVTLGYQHLIYIHALAHAFFTLTRDHDNMYLGWKALARGSDC